MHALKCDRCKRYYDINYNNSSTEYISCYKAGGIDNSLKPFDLCPECNREFKRWIEEGMECE